MRKYYSWSIFPWALLNFNWNYIISVFMSKFLNLLIRGLNWNGLSRILLIPPSSSSSVEIFMRKSWNTFLTYLAILPLGKIAIYSWSRPYCFWKSSNSLYWQIFQIILNRFTCYMLQTWNFCFCSNFFFLPVFRILALGIQVRKWSFSE